MQRPLDFYRWDAERPCRRSRPGRDCSPNRIQLGRGGSGAAVTATGIVTGRPVAIVHLGDPHLQVGPTLLSRCQHRCRVAFYVRVLVGRRHARRPRHTPDREPHAVQRGSLVKLVGPAYLAIRANRAGSPASRQSMPSFVPWTSAAVIPQRSSFDCGNKVKGDYVEILVAVGSVYRASRLPNDQRMGRPSIALTRLALPAVISI